MTNDEKLVRDYQGLVQMTTSDMVLAKMMTNGQWYIDGEVIDDLEGFMKIDPSSFIAISDYNINLLKRHNVTHVQLADDVGILKFDLFVRIVKQADSNKGS